MTRLVDTLLQEELRVLAREYLLLELSVFGSIARGDGRPDSDIDLLYVAGPSPPPGLAF